MKRLLPFLITVFCVWADTSARSGNVAIPDYGEAVSVDSPNETYYSPLLTQGNDSITITVQWTLKNVSSEKDDIYEFVLFDNDGNHISIANSVLKKATSKSVSFRCVPGIYNAIMSFKTKTPTASGMGKFVCRENMDIKSDTTLVFNGKDADKKIGFQYVLPDGEKPKVVTYVTSKEKDYTGVNVFRISLQRYFAHKKLPFWTMATVYPVENNRSTTGTDRTRSTDIFVNGGLSDNFYVGVNATVTMIDTVTKGKKTDAPLSVISLHAGCAAVDTVYSNKAGDFVKFTPPSTKRSLTAKSASAGYTYDYIFETLKNDSRIVGSIMYSGVTNKDGSINLCMQDSELGKLIFSTMSIEADAALPGSVADGAGIASPKVEVSGKGKISYLMNDNLGEGMKDIISEKGSLFYPRLPAHEFYSYSADTQDVEFGNSAPILSFPIFPTAPSATSCFTSPNGLSQSPQWIGNFGERRPIDILEMRFTALADKDTIASGWNDFRTKIGSHAKPEHDPHLITLQLDNRNFKVDTLQGRTYAEITYKEGNEDICVPTMQMMQFRNKDGKITNRFDNAGEGTLNFSYGDFNYTRPANRYELAPCEVKVEFAPYGSGNYAELKTEEIEEYKTMPVWGYFRRALIDKNLGYNPSGWFDLRFTLRDKAGNTQIQTVSPAFYAKFTTNGVNDIENSGSDLSVRGDELLTGDDSSRVEIWSMAGVRKIVATGSRVSISGLSSGVYVARVTDRRGVRTLKLIKK